MESSVSIFDEKKEIQIKESEPIKLLKFKSENCSLPSTSPLSLKDAPSTQNPQQAARPKNTDVRVVKYLKTEEIKKIAASSTKMNDSQKEDRQYVADNLHSSIMQEGQI